ncbi:hypothetical protein BDY21DRAFT_331256 [Lineolata rhizophorae]|uniref:Uncharacterized protein n=1 Tax=Lineolata rhizophorae TaxID=578093 RepID=A0A6A6PEF5_9PEZI|nr:hypothetical protein BDY21DRAFT_331256 [Lineolata rhizophorae]
MRLSLPSLLAAACIGVVAASPLNPPASLPNRRGLLPRQNVTNATTPCASVSAVAAAQMATATPTVPARIAWDCINSVPFNQSAAADLVAAMRPYINWQSTVNWLKNPPAEYAEKVQGAYDVWALVNELAEKVNSGSFANEYEFGLQLYKLFQQAHDGHFVYIPDSVGTVFQWRRPEALVSISEDGQAMPAIFVYRDILTTLSGNGTFEPSPVTQIDGVDAVEYLLELSQIGSLQDRDALWNNLFYALGQASLGTDGTAVGMFAGGGRGRYIYPGAETTLTFENGSTIIFENYARVLIPFTGIDSGETLYHNWFSVPLDASLAAGTSSVEEFQQAKFHGAIMKREPDQPLLKRQSSTNFTTPPGYPDPVIITDIVAGYYMPQEGYEDVAVLAVPSFSAVDDGDLNFQQVVERFLAQAKADGKTKLVIDLSANGGGVILQGYDLFKQLFPDIEPFGGNRFRAHEAFNLLGEQISDIVAPYPHDWSVDDDTLLFLMTTPFNYRNDLDEDLDMFFSWDEKFGPEVLGNDDNFTSIIRWNLSDPLISLSSGGINVTGYLNRSEGLSQPFAAEDVMIITDGYCASTCTIFSEMMRNQAGVRTIAMGGRPQSGPIQALGGVKGTNNYPWAAIKGQIEITVEQRSGEEQARLNASIFSDYTTYLPFYRSAQASSPNVNVRDGFRKGETNMPPLQFRYEDADCRILYTAEMTVDVTSLWKAAVDSTWGDETSCVDDQDLSAYGETRRFSKRALNLHPTISSSRLAQLEASLELFTDLFSSKLDGDGIMFP